MAPPADAGVPRFTADDFCEVYARTACRWAVTCGQRTAGEESSCVSLMRHRCPRPLKFDATAAQVCLLRLESSRCGPRAERCDQAWPASVADGGTCAADAECVIGVCTSDGGPCGNCSAAGALGAGCDAFHPCEASARCADADGGLQCRPLLAEGGKCAGLGDEACASGRCLFKVGAGLVCASAAPGSKCTTDASCARALFCDPLRGSCRVPAELGEACDSQAACAARGGSCLEGKCQQVAAFSVAEGGACSESAQCAWGLACEVRAAAPRCVRRIAFGAPCELAGLDVWDPRCPYLAICDPVKRVCGESATLCDSPGYCPAGPGPDEPCKAGSVCRGLSLCTEQQDGGSRCVPTDALPGQACFAPFASRACADSSCVNEVCAPWAAGCVP